MTLATKQVRFSDLDAFARSLEPRAQRAFLEAIQALKNSAHLAELERAVQAGSVGGVQRALRLDDLEEHLSPFRDVVLDAVRGGGEVAALNAALGVRFDITDERALRHVQRHAGLLIRGISDTTRRGVMRAIELEFTQGIAPATTARRIRDKVGLTDHQQEIVANYEATLRAAVRGDATWADVDRYRLNPIRGPGGLAERRIDAAVARYRQRLLNHRARVIAQHETLSAANEGRRQLWDQLQQRGALPPGAQREWLTAEDERVCPICWPLNGTRVGIGESYPGNLEPGSAHIGCRCSEAMVGL